VASFHDDDFDVGRRLVRRSGSSRRGGLFALRLSALLLLAGAVAFVCKWPELTGIYSVEEKLGHALDIAPPPDAPPTPVQSARLVYAYSVVPGGVADAADVRRAVAADAVVGEHYRGLNLARLTPAILRADTAAYVSFRKGDEVYWTTKKVRLAKGETVLSDGTNMVRARCGNRISDASMAHTAPQEPPEAELDTPLLPGGPMAPLQLPGPPEQVRLLAAAITPLLPEPPAPLPETPEELITSTPKDGTIVPPEQDEFAGPYWYVFPSPWSFSGWGVTPVPSPAPTSKKPSDPGGSGETGTVSETPLATPSPEPSSWLLVGVGMLGLGGLLTRARRQSNP
jgi:hypothetical protein